MVKPDRHDEVPEAQDFRQGEKITPLGCCPWSAFTIRQVGYGGGDEVNMLRRLLLGTPTKFGVGANGAGVASHFIQKYGCIDIDKSSWHEKQYLDQKVQDSLDSEKVGVVVLDDAMQVSEHTLKDIESIVLGIEKSVPIFLIKMDPTYLFEVGTINVKILLTALHEATILCVSAIGSAEPFVKQIQKDIKMIRAKLVELEGKFGSKPIVVITEKDMATIKLSVVEHILVSRGYGGGDEVNMLRRHLLGTSTKFGVGANRAVVASHFIQKYGYIDIGKSSWHEKQYLDQKVQDSLDSEKIGVVVLDDAMQVALERDLDIVMVNELTLWGNLQLLPRGPLMEPLTALRRADEVVIHHADLVSEHTLKDIESMVLGINKSVPIFLTKMDPTYLFEVGTINAKIPLTALHEATVLCVSAIGSAKPFVKLIQKDIEMIRAKLGELEGKFGSKPIVVITEKDYDRDPEILKQLHPFKVFVLCSALKVLPYRGSREDSFKKFLKDHLKLELPPALTNHVIEIKYLRFIILRDYLVTFFFL
ncbi:putative tetraacyldisaccharide 4'-kinase, mitochondrial [Glycine max]|nr:putative tetraacyldisaccharide 4'-kinase, mitochondrial [Glycine max]